MTEQAKKIVVTKELLDSIGVDEGDRALGVCYLLASKLSDEKRVSFLNDFAAYTDIAFLFSSTPPSIEMYLGAAEEPYVSVDGKAAEDLFHAGEKFSKETGVSPQEALRAGILFSFLRAEARKLKEKFEEHGLTPDNIEPPRE
jgi:hypothetical protein